MMKQRRYITLTAEAQVLLESGYKEGKKHHYREKCRALLLSHQKYTIDALAVMFDKQPDTIRKWFNRWESEGLKGLAIQSGRGMKPKLSVFEPELAEFVKKKSKNSR